jgi:hypothetical protein
MSLGGCFTIAEWNGAEWNGAEWNEPSIIIIDDQIFIYYSASLPWSSFRVITVEFIPRVITSQ